MVATYGEESRTSGGSQPGLAEQSCDQEKHMNSTYVSTSPHPIAASRASVLWEVVKDALAAAQRRKALLQTVTEATPPPATRVPKKRNLKGDKTPGEVTVTSSSTEKVTPDPKAIRTDPNPRVLFGECSLNMRHMICSVNFITEICL